MKVPKPPDEEKPSVKEHVEEAVDEELGEVYHLKSITQETNSN